MSRSQEHSTDADKLERKATPDNYQPSAHFKQQKKWRNMDGEWIPELIETGEIRENDPGETPDPDEDRGTHQFVKEILGFEWCIVVAYESDGPNELVTTYVIDDDVNEKADYDRYF